MLDAVPRVAARYNSIRRDKAGTFCGWWRGVAAVIVAAMGRGRDEFDGSQVVETRTMVLFWQPPAVFGQWTASRFTVDGATYGCAEQFMMAEKARLFGDEATRAKILAAGSPRQHKALGRQVAGFVQAVWDRECLDIVVRGNRAKFGQDKAAKLARRREAERAEALLDGAQREQDS